MEGRTFLQVIASNPRSSVIAVGVGDETESLVIGDLEAGDDVRIGSRDTNGCRNQE